MFMGQQGGVREQAGSTQIRSQRHIGVRAFSLGQKLIRTLIVCERKNRGTILKSEWYDLIYLLYALH